MAVIAADGIHEECGVFAIYTNNEEVASRAYYGLFALQHRGQEACGIATSNQGRIEFYKSQGLITEVFNEDNLSHLHGRCGIGHVRYSNSDGNADINIQPIVAHYLQGDVALAMNGSLTNTGKLRQWLAQSGSVFQTTTDAELVCNLLARYGHGSLDVSISQAMADLQGSYALVAMNHDTIYAARDPYGNRPLCIGKLPNGYCIASESCSLDTIGATFVRDVRPGETITLDADGIHSRDLANPPQPAHCAFEYVYFARPDSTIDGINVNLSRRRMGAILAREIADELDVDVVIPVPDSGTSAAIGFAEASGIEFTPGILKNRYTGRTFIAPTQEMREQLVKLKLNPIREELEGRRIAVVDDSIVRGTTSKRLVALLKERGAKEVHFLVTCPPVVNPCYYGIDTAERDRLIATKMDIEGIRTYIGADSLHFLSSEGLLEALGGEPRFCDACVGGAYHLGVPEEGEKR
ncbi:MAG: amidophosphoribosyltransferase [Clostridiales bacterium]|nr:amidophosphoribosyltransferase [Clostridiales bacterium]MDU1029314.1 amidophosphoribosyltransferase [Clostridiales bacterium]